MLYVLLHSVSVAGKCAAGFVYAVTIVCAAVLCNCCFFLLPSVLVLVLQMLVHVLLPMHVLQHLVGFAAAYAVAIAACAVTIAYIAAFVGVAAA